MCATWRNAIKNASREITSEGVAETIYQYMHLENVGKWAKRSIKTWIVRKGESRRRGLSKHASRESGKVADKTDLLLGCPLPISSITPVLSIAVIGTNILSAV
jgi:hypothetical protein